MKRLIGLFGTILIFPCTQASEERRPLGEGMDRRLRPYAHMQYFGP